MVVSLEDLLKMEPGQFEMFVTSLLKKLGYAAETTRLTADGGIDVWADDDRPLTGGRIIIQCKRYAVGTTVGEPVLRELFGLVHAHGVNKGVLVTTSSFTKGAREFAKGKPIELIEGAELLSICRKAGLEVGDEDLKTVEAFEDLSDGPQLLNFLIDWNGAKPNPYLLRFCATSREVLERIDNFRIEQIESGIAFKLYYFMAANHLLSGAVFRPDHDPVNLDDWTQSQISALCCAYKRWREGNAEEARLEDEEEKYMCAGVPWGTRIARSIGSVEADLQELCAKFWWKPHKDVGWYGYKKYFQ